MKVLLEHLKPDVNIIFLKRCLAEQTISADEEWNDEHRLRLDTNRAENQITNGWNSKPKDQSKRQESREIELNTTAA